MLQGRFGLVSVSEHIWRVFAKRIATVGMRVSGENLHRGNQINATLIGGVLESFISLR